MFGTLLYFLVVPPYLLISLALMLGFSFAEIFSGWRFFRIREGDCRRNCTRRCGVSVAVCAVVLFSLAGAEALTLWFFSVAPQFVQNVPSFLRQAALFVAVYAVFYGALLQLLRFPILHRVTDPKKRKRLFWYVWGISVAIYLIFAGICIAIYGTEGIAEWRVLTPAQ